MIKMHGWNMDLRKLHHAVCLADAGSFSAAADLARIGQPALSRSIQALEAECGQALFKRTGRGVVLTSAGSSLIPQARTLLRQASEFTRQAKLIAGGKAGQVAIGLGPSISSLSLPLLESCWTPAPRVHVQLHVLPIRLMMEMLLHEELDFFVSDLRAAANSRELKIEPLAELAYGYHVRSGHPLAKGRYHPLSKLMEFPLLSPNLGSEGGGSPFSWSGHVGCESLTPLLPLLRESDAILLSTHFAVREALSAGQVVTLMVEGHIGQCSTVGVVSLRDIEPTAVATRYRNVIGELLGRCCQTKCTGLAAAAWAG